MDDIIKEFLVESFESLDRLDQDFVALESDPSNTEILNAIFRTVHTIKGTCGFLSLTTLEKIAHVGETLLDSLRAGRCSYTTAAASALLELVDAIRAILHNIEETGGEGENSYSELAATLTALNESSGASPDLESSEKESAASESPEMDTESEVATSSSEGSTEEESLAEAKDETEKSLPSEPELNSEQEVSPQQPLESQASSDEEMEGLIEELDQSLDKHRPAATAIGSEESSEIVDTDALLAQFDSGAIESDEDEQPQQESVGTPPHQEDDVANHDLIAEIMGSDDFQAVLNQEMAVSSGAPQEKKPSSEDSSETSDQMDSQSAVQDKTHDEVAVQSTPKQVSEESAPPREAAEQVEEEKTMVESSEQLPENKKPSAPVPSNSGSSSGGRSTSLADTSLRVDVALLDEVMNLVGELVLARNQILQFTKTQTDSAFVNTCQRLNLITSELQEGVMKTRMQPIANVWNKFPRVVRDVAKSCGKDIAIEMEGKETELDKTILEAIKDPLTHIVRNSADHGIEDPQTREEKGKPRQGTLLLRAYHEGGHVIIEISDDGAGLNTDRIRAKALEKGIISSEQASRLSEQDVQRLIFKPGFSTAEKVTNVSGRGVGMDVVRSNIEKIGGQVDIQSQINVGTTLSIKIPLTLAIVPALIVTCEKHRFAIPQVNLLELLRVEEDDVASKIEEIKGAYFYRLRGNLLPLVYLSQELETHIESPSEENQGRELNIVVVKAEEKEFGLVVEKVHDTEEIVVKPLGRQLKNIHVFSGATIMGDGKVALILDIFGLAKKAHVVQDLLDNGAEEHVEESVVEGTDRQSLLLVGIGAEGRLAIPLDMVNRLEEFSMTTIESASGRQVVQYRGGILPLVDLPSFFSEEEESFLETNTESEQKSVVVYSEGGRFVGLIVDSILDIVDENVQVSYTHGRTGIRGSAIIQNKVTDLLDIHEVLKAREPSFFGSSNSTEMGV